MTFDVKGVGCRVKRGTETGIPSFGGFGSLAQARRPLVRFSGVLCSQGPFWGAGLL